MVVRNLMGEWNLPDIHRVATVLKQAWPTLPKVRPSNREGLRTTSGGSGPSLTICAGDYFR